MSERSAWLLKMAGGSGKKTVCAEVGRGEKFAKNLAKIFGRSLMLKLATPRDPNGIPIC